MLLIAQILLTVQAWRKGWRAWALLPVGIDLLIGILIGMAVEDIDQALAPCLISGLVSLGVLIVLVVKAPRPVQIPVKQEAVAF
jgi:hypothetical protein